jgi:amino acid transporter
MEGFDVSSRSSHASGTPVPAPRVAAVDRSDQRLAELGYKTWTPRRWNGFANWAISGAIISVPTGVFSLYGFDMNAGGPAEIMFGWIAVSIGTLLVALGMAELCAKFPTSGALYYWASRLAPQRSAPKWAWFTAHLNFTGLIAGTAAVDYAASVFLQALLSMRWNYTATHTRTIAIFFVILVLQALVNTYAVPWLAVINKASMWWLFGAVAAIAAALVLIPGHHQTLSFALTSTYNHSGFRHGVYVAAIGLTLGGYTFCGFDASAHVSEETTHPEDNASRGIVRSVYLSAIAGVVLLFVLNYATQNYRAEAAAANPPVQVLLDALNQGWAQLLLAGVLVCMLTCGLAGVTANSRMCFAVSRDGVLPFHAQWRKVSDRRGVPVRAVWFVTALSGGLGLFTYAGQNNVVFNALTSVNVVGVFTAYAIPILLRLRQGDAFTADSKFSLGRYGRPVALAAVVWVAVLDVVVCLPQFTPLWTWGTFPYASVLLVGVLIASQIGWWVRRARGNPFTGPSKDVTPEYLEQFVEMV